MKPDLSFITIEKTRNRVAANIDWSKVTDIKESCWNWEGAINNGGYGVGDFLHEPETKFQYIVSRLVYSYYYKGIPDGLFICHHCDNPQCCNPHHLFAGTHKDNMEDHAQKKKILKLTKELSELQAKYNKCVLNKGITTIKPVKEKSSLLKRLLSFLNQEIKELRYQRACVFDKSILDDRIATYLELIRCIERKKFPKQ